HLGIFVSGRVAKREHAQIVEVLQHIERLRPGLYLMRIQDVNDGGKVRYEVTLEEKSVEDVRRANKYERKDETPFEVVESVSQMNEKAYTLFARPFIRPMANENTAMLGRMFNPMRWQCWAFSDLNPMMWPLSEMAQAIKDDRRPAAADNPYLTIQKMGSKAISAWLDLIRDLRDAMQESLFFQIYGSMAALGAAETKWEEGLETKVAPRELPFVKEALSAIDKGGYPEAVARIGALVAKRAKGETIQLHELKFADDFIRSDKVLSKMSEDEIRRIRNEQVIIVEFEPERALQSLPVLLANRADREKILEVLKKAVSVFDLTKSEVEAVEEIRYMLSSNHRRVKSASIRTESQPRRLKA
ncbi:MAG TPA: DUF3141 domain-containing protein, partial [Thermodesulfobacteriota bacterium]|nr:DUF3141 domain-containing protein [Thermodesulfobacteriota bacterium]